MGGGIHDGTYPPDDTFMRATMTDRRQRVVEVTKRNVAEARSDILKAIEMVPDIDTAAQAESSLSDLLDEVDRLQELIMEYIPHALKRATIGQLMDELVTRGVTLFRLDAPTVRVIGAGTIMQYCTDCNTRGGHKPECRAGRAETSLRAPGGGEL